MTNRARNSALSLVTAVVLLGLLFIVPSCGGGGGGGVTGGTATYAVGVLVSGLTGTLVLQNNTTDDLTISANGTFNFATKIADGAGYDVTVKTPPVGQSCIVSSGSGTVTGSDVTTVSVDCSNLVLTGVSVAPASLVAGDTGNIVVFFTTADVWLADGKLVIVFPAGFDVSGVTCGTITGADGTCTASPVGQTVTLTRAGGTTTPGGTAVTATVGSIRNPQIAGLTGTFAVTQTTSAGASLGSNTAAGVTILPGALGSVSATPASLSAGATGNFSVGFTTANPWPSDGKLAIVFPAGFDASGAAFVSANVVDGSFAVSVAGQIVTVTRSGGTATSAGTAVTLTLGGIRNPLSAGVTGTFSLTIETNAGTAIDSGTAAGVTITPGALTSASATPASLSAGATGNFLAGFTTANPWPSNGKLAIIFPAGFDVSGVTCGTITGANGTCTASPVGQTVTLTRTGGTTAAGSTAVTVTLGGVRNPLSAGVTGTFSLTTETNAGAAIDAGTAAGVTIN